MVVVRCKLFPLKRSQEPNLKEYNGITTAGLAFFFCVQNIIISVLPHCCPTFWKDIKECFPLLQLLYTLYALYYVYNVASFSPLPLVTFPQNPRSWSGFAGRMAALEQQFALETTTVIICRSTRTRKSRRAMFVLRCWEVSFCSTKFIVRFHIHPLWVRTQPNHHVQVETTPTSAWRSAWWL